MSEPIKPALTVEQWVSVYENGELSVEPHVGEYPARLHVYIMDACDSGEGSTTDAGIELSPKDRHALSAFALYGQPFGFTRAHLKLLEHCEASVGWKLEEEVRELAALIEALLPPETK